MEVGRRARVRKTGLRFEITEDTTRFELANRLLDWGAELEGQGVPSDDVANVLFNALARWIHDREGYVGVIRNFARFTVLAAENGEEWGHIEPSQGQH